jgi:hypothetical protein
MHLTRPARLSLALIPVLLLAASALRAQEPARAPAVPTSRSVSFDVAALAKDHFRGSIEAMALGRFTVGLSGSYSHTVDQVYSVYAPYDYATMNRLWEPGCYAAPESFSCIGPYWNTPPRYRAWALDLSIRYYPSVLSFQNGPSRTMVYVGEFVGYHWRTWDEQGPYYYGAYGPDDAMPRVSSDSVIPPYPDTAFPRYPIWPGPNPIRRTLDAIQPGVELGVRFLPFSGLFIDVGGRFTLVTIEDPMQRALKGNVESRLVVAGGLVW